MFYNNLNIKMGLTASHRKSLLNKYTEALQTNNTDDLREIANSEIMGDGNMLNIAIKGGYIESIKFLIDFCSIYQ